MKTLYWKVVYTGEGDDEVDTIYIAAVDKQAAEAKFAQHYGTVPDHLVEWSEIDVNDVPDGAAL